MTSNSPQGDPLEAYIFRIEYYKYLHGAGRQEGSPFFVHEFKGNEPMPPIPPVGTGFYWSKEGHPFSVQGVVQSVKLSYMSGAMECWHCWYTVVIEEPKPITTE